MALSLVDLGTSVQVVPSGATGSAGGATFAGPFWLNYTIGSVIIANGSYNNLVESLSGLTKRVNFASVQNLWNTGITLIDGSTGVGIKTNGATATYFCAFPHPQYWKRYVNLSTITAPYFYELTMVFRNGLLTGVSCFSYSQLTASGYAGTKTLIGTIINTFGSGAVAVNDYGSGVELSTTGITADIDLLQTWRADVFDHAIQTYCTKYTLSYDRGMLAGISIGDMSVYGTF
jgi:hypothetical protein